MTLAQLKRMHASLLSEFNRAVIRRRKNIQKVMAAEMADRRRSRAPNVSHGAAARSLKRKLYNTIYRSVMNKASNPRCGRWTKVRGVWGADSWRKYKCKS